MHAAGDVRVTSLQLFVMVVNISNSRIGYRDDDFYVPMLLYADDGLVLCR